MPKGMPGACCSSSSEAIQSVLDGLPIDPHLSAPVSRTVCAAVKAGEQIQTLARGYQQSPGCRGPMLYLDPDKQNQRDPGTAAMDIFGPFAWGKGES